MGICAGKYDCVCPDEQCDTSSFDAGVDVSLHVRMGAFCTVGAVMTVGVGSDVQLGTCVCIGEGVCVSVGAGTLQKLVLRILWVLVQVRTFVQVFQQAVLQEQE